ncbi:MAG: hypothetical protein IT273_02155 [Chitinophagales bacterium]|nr:hypothetical protein [Chitinophagales bacterium]
MSHFFADEGWALSDFAQYFAVHCPKCQGKAEVDASKRLRCGACFHTEVEGHWYGGAELLVQVKCRECYAPIQARGTWLGNWNRLTTTCSRCGDTCQYEGTLIKLRCHQGLMTDPVFGLPLWYQANFKGDLFWAFNAAHLQYLSRYVAAKHRERGISPRNTIKKNSSMLSRLPDFIRSAKNRDDLSKLIAKLLNKI